MQDSREASYYEIALTNRQVVVFFVVLLVCVVGAFFSGLWLGQRRSGETEQLAQAGIEERDEGAARGDEPLEELNFFTEDPGSRAAVEGRAETRRSPGERPEIEAEGNPETTLLEDLRGAEPAVEESPPASASESSPPASTPSTSTPPTSLPRRSEPAPQPDLSPPPAAATADGYVIQVFSSPDGDQARKLLERLVDGGYSAFLSPVEVEGRTMHRVRIGPLPTKGEADDLAAEVGKAYQVDTWVTRNE